MEAILPYIKDCYSMGPDLNVDMQELDSVGKKLGIPSVKMAIATAMGWDIKYFPITGPQEIGITNKYVMISILTSTPIVILIKNKDARKSFMQYFEAIWKISER